MDGCVEGETSLRLLHEKLTACYSSLTADSSSQSAVVFRYVSQVPFDRILLNRTPDDATAFPVVLLCIRCLRNALALCCHSPKCTVSCREVLLARLARVLCEAVRIDRPDLLRCVLQTFGNLVARDQTTCDAVWCLFRPELAGLLEHSDIKVADYFCMVLGSLMRHNDTVCHEFSLRDDLGQLIVGIVSLIGRESEFALLLVEELCRTQLVAVLETIDQPQLAAQLADIVLSRIERDCDYMSQQCIVGISDCFIRLSQQFPHSTDSAPFDEDLAVFANSRHIIHLKHIVDVLGALTAVPVAGCNGYIGEATLMACVRLIKSTHFASKRCGNPFTSLKLTARNVSAVQVTAAPTFALKSSLMRLLVNLTNPVGRREWRRLAADEGVVPVLMECCCLDARQPLLQQWAVLAIRNLCVDCVENQQLISQLQLQQLSPEAAEQLMQLGISAVSERGRIRLERSGE